MNTKTKIAIAVLIVGIFIIGLFLILKNQMQDFRVTNNKTAYSISENVTFRINDAVQICTNELPYRIVNSDVNKPYGMPVNLQHSCFGFAGSGFDQYCENGKIKTVNTEDRCSDAIVCQNKFIGETFAWDQTEYVEITEQCEGKNITREIKRQVATGTYQIIVNGKVFKEFKISNKME